MKRLFSWPVFFLFSRVAHKHQLQSKDAYWTRLREVRWQVPWSTVRGHPKKAPARITKAISHLPCPRANTSVVSSYIGYITAETEVDVPYSGELAIIMQEGGQQIQQVVVTSNSYTEKVTGTQIGVEKIRMDEMAKMPAMFGERDIIRSIQLLPGIKSDNEGSSGFQVRGGTSAQNLILLDDSPVYNAGHLMGIFSTFNDDALSSASLYKGLIPAQYGGGTSSVFDIQSKNGNLQSYNVNGSIGILSAKLSAEGPIIRDKVSFLVSAAAHLLRPLPEDAGGLQKEQDELLRR